jgi:hypothetical protein
MISIPSPEVKLPSSTWAPKNEKVLEKFQGVKNFFCEPIYMVSNLVSNFFVAVREGAIDAIFTPEKKEEIEKVANKLIPFVSDKLEVATKKK